MSNNTTARVLRPALRAAGLVTVQDTEATYRPAVLDAEGVINGVVQHVATTNCILRALADAGILLVKQV